MPRTAYVRGPLVNLHVQLYPDQLRRLEDTRDGRPRAEMVRRAVDEYLRQAGQAKGEAVSV